MRTMLRGKIHRATVTQCESGISQARNAAPSCGMYWASQIRIIGKSSAVLTSTSAICAVARIALPCRVFWTNQTRPNRSGTVIAVTHDTELAGMARRRLHVVDGRLASPP